LGQIEHIFRTDQTTSESSEGHISAQESVYAAFATIVVAYATVVVAYATTVVACTADHFSPYGLGLHQGLLV
jgi:hypothetical protein